jgi:type VII secretion integral membrane protein EccD
MSRYTRLTVVGSLRRADVVVPSDEAVAVLLPQVLDLLTEPSGAGSLVLVRSTGQQVDLALDATEQDLADGEVLRVERLEDAPPPPEVADVTGTTAETYADRRGRWSPGARHATGAAAVGVLLGSAGLLVVRAPDAPALGVLAGSVAALLVLAVALGRAARWVSLAATSGAVGLAPALAVAAVDRAGDLAGNGAAAARTTLVVAALVGWLALAAGGGAGRRDRGALAGAGLGTGVALLDLALTATGLAPDRVGALVGVVAVVALGVLPTYAMAASGLSGLDDAALEGHPQRRPRVLASLDDAYRALTWSTVACAVALVLAVPPLLASRDPWATAAGLLLLAVAALRTRPLPMSAQVVALWGAVVVGLVAGAVGRLVTQPGLAAAVLALVGAGAVALVSLDPNAQQRARWRRVGDTAELACVVALLPVVLGVLGVYADLLRTF